MAADALLEALDVTEDMYIAALQTDWDVLAELLRRQTALLDAPSPNRDAQQKAEILGKIKELTDQVIELAEQYRDDLGKQLIQIKKGGDVKSAYLQNL